MERFDVEQSVLHLSGVILEALIDATARAGRFAKLAASGDLFGLDAADGSLYQRMVIGQSRQCRCGRFARGGPQNFVLALGDGTPLFVHPGEGIVAVGSANGDLLQAHRELQEAYEATLRGWVHGLDLRDRETADHSRRVTLLTVELARLMGMPETELLNVRRSALLHDIGKMGVPDHILHKPGPLTEAEWVIMRKHPQIAYDMLAPIEYLRSALDIPFCHHERWDGTGYPRRLKGEQIPLVARIFAVIDVFDALSSDRPYRKAWPQEKIIEYIREQSGTHFDPKAVELFLQMMARESQPSTTQT